MLLNSVENEIRIEGAIANTIALRRTASEGDVNSLQDASKIDIEQGETLPELVRKGKLKSSKNRNYSIKGWVVI